MYRDIQSALYYPSINAPIYIKFWKDKFIETGIKYSVLFQQKLNNNDQ